MDDSFDQLVFSPGDVDLVHRTDSVDDAYEYVVRHLSQEALDSPGAKL